MSDIAIKSSRLKCPQCSAALDVKLTHSQSITCSACNSLIDLTQGVSDDLNYVEQDPPSSPVKPLIPLGSTGSLQDIRWQVVGFSRCKGHTTDSKRELQHWDMYSLFNDKAGLAFLVDTKPGWLMVKPASDVPVQQSDKTYQCAGTSYTYGTPPKFKLNAK